MGIGLRLKFQLQTNAQLFCQSSDASDFIMSSLRSCDTSRVLSLQPNSLWLRMGWHCMHSMGGVSHSRVHSCSTTQLSGGVYQPHAQASMVTARCSTMDEHTASSDLLLLYMHELVSTHTPHSVPFPQSSMRQIPLDLSLSANKSEGGL